MEWKQRNSNVIDTKEVEALIFYCSCGSSVYQASLFQRNATVCFPEPIKVSSYTAFIIFPPSLSLCVWSISSISPPPSSSIFPSVSVHANESLFSALTNTLVIVKPWSIYSFLCTVLTQCSLWLLSRALAAPFSLWSLGSPENDASSTHRWRINTPRSESGEQTSSPGSGTKLFVRPQSRKSSESRLWIRSYSFRCVISSSSKMILLTVFIFLLESQGYICAELSLKLSSSHSNGTWTVACSVVAEVKGQCVLCSRRNISILPKYQRECVNFGHLLYYFVYI